MPSTNGTKDGGLDRLASVIATGVLMFLVNVFITTRNGPKAPLDPWDARTLEWMTTSPPKEHNFDAIPKVHALDEFFHRKYEEVETDEGPKLVKVKTAEEIFADQEAHADKHIHMPSPSYWPILVAFSLPFIAFGVIFSTLLAVVAAAFLVFTMFGWALEPSVADDSDYDPPTDTEPGTSLAIAGGHA
jgi:cytochrome c oxidase subunit 1